MHNLVGSTGSRSMWICQELNVIDSLYYAPNANENTYLVNKVLVILLHAPRITIGDPENLVWSVLL